MKTEWSSTCVVCVYTTDRISFIMMCVRDYRSKICSMKSRRSKLGKAHAHLSLSVQGSRLFQFLIKDIIVVQQGQLVIEINTVQICRPIVVCYCRPRSSSRRSLVMALAWREQAGKRGFTVSRTCRYERFFSVVSGRVARIPESAMVVLVPIRFLPARIPQSIRLEGK